MIHFNNNSRSQRRTFRRSHSGSRELCAGGMSLAGVFWSVIRRASFRTIAVSLGQVMNQTE
jgi:hypothetical protein